MAAGSNSTSSNDADLMIDIAAGVVDATSVASDRRTDERYPYTADVGVAPVDNTGEILNPVTLSGRNISIGGICLTGRKEFAPGTYIVMQLVRSSGSTAIVGARAQHCRYVGDMIHETGFLFTPLPAGVKPDDLLNDDGSIRSLRGTKLSAAPSPPSD